MQTTSHHRWLRAQALRGSVISSKRSPSVCLLQHTTAHSEIMSRRSCDHSLILERALLCRLLEAKPPLKALMMLFRRTQAQGAPPWRSQKPKVGSIDIL